MDALYFVKDNRMIDTETIRATYAKMPDESLKVFAQTEAKGLTQKAFIVLKQEMRKRGIGSEIIADAEAKRVDVAIDKINSNQHKYNWKNHIKLWEFVFRQKYENTPDPALMSKLVEKGYHPYDAMLLIEGIEPIIHKLVEDYKAERMSGIVIFIIGATGAFYFSGNGQENLLTRLWLSTFPYIVLVIGLLRFLHGSKSLAFCQVILNNISAARNNDEVEEE